MMSTILIVEDMQDINDMLKQYLQNDGYSCTQAFSGTEALLLLKNETFDLILLDLMLPGLTGEALLTQIKKKSGTPVIILSAKDTVDTRVEVLELGADDYICKPFVLKEVLARVHVQLRKRNNGTNQLLQIKNMRLNLTTVELMIDDHKVALTKHEFNILRLLMESPNQVFTKQAIYEYAWEDDYYGDERIINTHIGNLRAKFRQYSDQDYIQTVWGIGFKFADV